MTWREFFNGPMYVFGLVAVVLGTWLVLQPLLVEEIIRQCVMPILQSLFVVAIMIWGIRFMIFGGKKGGKRKG